MPVPGGGFVTIHFDLEVTALSSYTPFNSSLNVLNGRFAQINLAANHHVDLRATVKRSCARSDPGAQGDSCNHCAALPEFGQRVQCFTAGCYCLGVKVRSVFACDEADKQAYRVAYDCPEMDDTLVLPTTVRALRAHARGGGRHLLPWPCCPRRPRRAHLHAPGFSRANTDGAWPPLSARAGDGRHVRVRL